MLIGLIYFESLEKSNISFSKIIKNSVFCVIVKNIEFFCKKRWKFSESVVNYMNRAVPWCNGSTSDFGSFSLGSTPGGTANFLKNARILKKTLAFLKKRGIL